MDGKSGIYINDDQALIVFLLLYIIVIDIYEKIKWDTHTTHSLSRTLLYKLKAHTNGFILKQQ